MSDATLVLREWAQAIRGDWGGIDGRSCREQLEQIADWIDYPETAPSLPAMREKSGVCPAGNGHWRWHCDIEECDR